MSKIVLRQSKNKDRKIYHNKTIYHLTSEGKTSITHLSSVIREYILYQEGGIWMDAILCMMIHLMRISTNMSIIL